MKTLLPAILALGLFSFSMSAVSQTPPMGWNSYDSKNFSATEAEAKAVTDTLEGEAYEIRGRHLKSPGTSGKKDDPAKGAYILKTKPAP